jgi:hypothetical protein
VNGLVCVNNIASIVPQINNPLTQNLREENRKLDIELESLEKEYLVKVNQLLIMTQMVIFITIAL